jgi:hypothetical protein
MVVADADGGRLAVRLVGRLAATAPLPSEKRAGTASWVSTTLRAVV